MVGIFFVRTRNAGESVKHPGGPQNKDNVLEDRSCYDDAWGFINPLFEGRGLGGLFP